MEGFQCVEMLALTAAYNKETFFNREKGKGSWNTDELHNFYKTHNMRYKTFEDFGRDSEIYKPFFDRLEILLNWAVYWTACALKYYLKEFDGICPDCQEDDDEPSKDKDNNRMPPPPGELEFVSRFGPFAVILALAGFIGKKLFPTKFR